MECNCDICSGNDLVGNSGERCGDCGVSMSDCVCERCEWCEDTLEDCLCEYCEHCDRPMEYCYCESDEE